MNTETLKSERIELRTTETAKELLQRAAQFSQKSVSEFLLDAGLRAAEQTLADRRLFLLDTAQWEAFQEALERPVSEKPRLALLLQEPSVLEKP
jgi:uncharacterized protein (DUF1778 family)